MDKIYRLKNGLIVTPNDHHLASWKVVSTDDYDQDEGTYTWEVGETFRVISNGHKEDPAKWTGGSFGESYDVLEVENDKTADDSAPNLKTYLHRAELKLAREEGKVAVYERLIPEGFTKLEK